MSEDKQAKESVIKQMQAFCKLSPGDRRAALNEAGCTRKVIPEKVALDRPQLPKCSVPRAGLKQQRSATVRSATFLVVLWIVL